MLRTVVITCMILVNAGVVDAQEEQTGRVVIHSDPRLAVLVSKSHNYVRPTRPEAPPPIIDVPVQKDLTERVGDAGLVHHDTKMIYKGRGYRVQIYNGSDRSKAIDAKKQFMRRFPGVNTYIMYMAPSFRVKVGDYVNRNDAQGMLREANSMFGPSMIVPDLVTISTY